MRQIQRVLFVALFWSSVSLASSAEVLFSKSFVDHQLKIKSVLSDGKNASYVLLQDKVLESGILKHKLLVTSDLGSKFYTLEGLPNDSILGFGRMGFDQNQKLVIPFVISNEIKLYRFDPQDNKKVDYVSSYELQERVNSIYYIEGSFYVLSRYRSGYKFKKILLTDETNVPIISDIDIGGRFIEHLEDIVYSDGKLYLAGIFISENKKRTTEIVEIDANLLLVTNSAQLDVDIGVRIKVLNVNSGIGTVFIGDNVPKLFSNRSLSVLEVDFENNLTEISSQLKANILSFSAALDCSSGLARMFYVVPESNSHVLYESVSNSSKEKIKIALSDRYYYQVVAERQLKDWRIFTINDLIIENTAVNQFEILRLEHGNSKSCN